MNYFLIIAIFFIILFMYLHIQFHLKSSSDLELFEIYETTKESMEEICDIRQPTVFNNLDDALVNYVISKINIDALNDKYPQFNVQIREMASQNNEYASVPLNTALELMNASSRQNSSASFFSENNADFFLETSVLKNISDRVLRPYLTSRCDYDIMFGSNGCVTPLRYNVNYRNFFICTKGTIFIKLVPPKYSNQLDPIYDYDLFEFRSDSNLWSKHPSSVKSLEIALTPGKILFIPSYWWSSFQFGENSSVACFKYRTYVNMVAHLPHYFMCLLQRNNVHKKITKSSIQDELTFSNKSKQNDLSDLSNIHKDEIKQDIVLEIKEEKDEIKETKIETKEDDKQEKDENDETKEDDKQEKDENDETKEDDKQEKEEKEENDETKEDETKEDETKEHETKEEKEEKDEKDEKDERKEDDELGKLNK